MKRYISILNQDLYIKILTTKELLDCIQLSYEVENNLRYPNISTTLISIISEYSTLCFFCLFRDNKQFFSDPFQVIQALSIDELDFIFQEYDKLFYNFKSLKISDSTKKY